MCFEFVLLIVFNRINYEMSAHSVNTIDKRSHNSSVFYDLLQIIINNNLLEKTIQLINSMSENNLMNNMWSKKLKTNQQTIGAYGGIQSLESLQSLGSLSVLPDEIIVNILMRLSLQQLSIVSITSKTFRDFIIEFIVKTKTNFDQLLIDNSLDFKTGDQRKRLEMYQTLGLMIKRMSCLFPTSERIQLLFVVLDKIKAIPSPTDKRIDYQITEKVLQCYGYLIHKLIAGWDDSECVFVFQVFEDVTNMGDYVDIIVSNNFGFNKTYEMFVRNFYRLIYMDPCLRHEDSVFWLNLILKRHSLHCRAKLLAVIFGPTVVVSHSTNIELNTPYIGWWDLTDTTFIHQGLEDLGYALHLLFRHSKKDSFWNQHNVISLLEVIITQPENWLQENIASLLYFAGDDITYAFLESKFAVGNVTFVANCLVYLTLVSYKLSEDNKTIMEILNKLYDYETKQKVYYNELINEIPIAFNEAISEIDNLIETDDERDVTELHDLIGAQSALMKTFMRKIFPLPLSDCNTKISKFGVTRNEE